MVCRYFMSGTWIVAAADRGFDVGRAMDGHGLQFFTAVEPGDDARGRLGLQHFLLLEDVVPDPLRQAATGTIRVVAEIRIADDPANLRRGHAAFQRRHADADLVAP